MNDLHSVPLPSAAAIHGIALLSNCQYSTVYITYSLFLFKACHLTFSAFSFLSFSRDHRTIQILIHTGLMERRRKWVNSLSLPRTALYPLLPIIIGMLYISSFLITQIKDKTQGTLCSPMLNLLKRFLSSPDFGLEMDKSKVPFLDTT